MHIQTDITFEVIDVCNFACSMCSIWKNKNMHRLSPLMIGRVVSEAHKRYGAVESVSLTGGECYTHPEIQQIISVLGQMVACGDVGALDIVTNGSLVDKVVDSLKGNMDLVNSGKFSIAISVDGIGDTHDRQRGRVGSFDMILSLVSLIRTDFPTIPICFKYTVTDANAGDILALHEMVHILGVSFAPKIVETGVTYYYHRDGAPTSGQLSEKSVAVCKDSFSQLSDCERCNGPALNLQQQFLVSGNHSSLPCYTPLKSLFVTARGDVFPCIYDKPITNIYDASWTDALLSLSHKKIISKGVKKECGGCLAYHGFLKHFNYPREKNERIESVT